MKKALIVEGGALRSVFSSGVLDGFIENGFNPFDFYIGISGGLFNLITYVAGQAGHSFDMYMKFALDKRFIDYRRFIAGGDLLDLDWVVSNVLNSSRKHIKCVLTHGCPIYAGVTNADTGDGVYVQLSNYNIIQTIKATMSLPLLYRVPPVIDGSPMLDGGIADGIPVREAIRRGAKQILVIRSRHHDYEKKDTVVHRFIRWKMRKYPNLVKTMRQRVKIYDDNVQLIRHPPIGVTITEICPPKSFSSGRFERDKEHLACGYYAGIDGARTAIERWPLS